MSKRKRILVAVLPEVKDLVESALTAEHEVTFADSFSQAKQLLEESVSDGASSGFNAVIGGLLFDDSRMFDLLRFMRAHERLSAVPFLAIQAIPSTLVSLDSPSTERSVRLMGACGLLNLVDLPGETAVRALSEAVNKCLNNGHSAPD